VPLLVEEVLLLEAEEVLLEVAEADVFRYLEQNRNNNLKTKIQK
jgi:hypothetical protein